MTTLADFTAEIAERTVVITCPDNDRGGAQLPADGWEDRAKDAHPTLHDIEGPTIGGAYAMRWRGEICTDHELLRRSLAIVRSEPPRSA
jgi:hypothetical protein